MYSGCIEDALVSRLANSDATYDNLTRSFSGAFQDKHSDEGFYHINVAEALFVPEKVSERNMHTSVQKNVIIQS